MRLIISDNLGTTSLIEAAWYDRTDAISALLAAGANIEEADYAGWRALHAASSPGRVATATLLLDAGADVNAPSKSGSTPLAWAKTPEMRALLVARGGV